MELVINSDVCNCTVKEGLTGITLWTQEGHVLMHVLSACKDPRVCFIYGTLGPVPGFVGGQVSKTGI